ncbi:hypothetical protein M9458_010950, partial [Cirrhinus mrigala]
ITMEPELCNPSDQVCEPVTTAATREYAEASVVAERSCAHCNMAEGELVKNLGLFEAPPPWLLAPSSLPLLHQAPLSFRFHLGLALTILHHFSGFSLVLCHSTCNIATCSVSALRILLITLAHRLSVSTSGSSATCSAAIALPPTWHLPPLAPPWAIIMAVDWVPPGSSCPKCLLLSPWLLSPS